MKSSFLVAAALTAALAATASADNWPQWRGLKNDGLSAEKGRPSEWGADKSAAWKLKMPGIGAGTPDVVSPIRVGDVIYCAGTGCSRHTTPRPAGSSTSAT